MATTLERWRKAPRPNYKLNTDFKFPYSELLFEEDFFLYRLDNLKNGSFISLVDFWGEGRIMANGLISGFQKSYNINHQYQLVSNGISKGHKIPNRIPTKDYNTIDTSNYIEDSVVNHITLMGAPITRNCAIEMTRMIRKDHGVIIIYGFKRTENDIKTLERELRNIHFYNYPNYLLRKPFNEITLTKDYLVYVNATVLTNDSKKEIDNGNYFQAKELLKSLDVNSFSKEIREVIDYASNSYKIFPLGYEFLKDAQTLQIFSAFFHENIKGIIKGEIEMTLTNKMFNMPLKLEWNVDGDGDRIAYGGDAERGIEQGNEDRFYWKFSAIENGKYFSITNDKFKMPLKLGFNSDKDGDRMAYGGDVEKGIEQGNEDRFYWRLNPINKGKYFSIMNKKFKMLLKLEWNADGTGDRKTYGGNSDTGLEKSNEDRFYWDIKSK